MSPLERWKAVLEMQGLSKSEKAVLGSLAYRAKDPVVWPSLATLANETAYDRSSVRRAIRRLAARGIITIENQSAGRASNRYRLRLDQPVNHATVAPCNGSTMSHQPAHHAPPTRAPCHPNVVEGTGKEQNTPSATPSIWDLWISVAGEKHRPTLGRLIRDHGEIEVAKAVAVVVQKNPADPVSYIHGILKPRTRMTAV